MKELEISLKEFMNRWPLVYSKIGLNYRYEAMYFSEYDLDKWEKSLSNIREIEHENLIEEESSKREAEEWVLLGFEEGTQIITTYNQDLYNEIKKKCEYRRKLNNLRELRIKDLLELKKLRGGVFSNCYKYDYIMNKCFDFLYNQLEDFKENIYINKEMHLMFFHPKHKRDTVRFSNKYLISKFNITPEEEKYMKSIISKGEKKRRNNEYNKVKFKRERRNLNGLTSREQTKRDNEEKILNLINEGLNKTQIAEKMGLNKSSMSSTYKNLFKR